MPATNEAAPPEGATLAERLEFVREARGFVAVRSFFDATVDDDPDTGAPPVSYSAAVRYHGGQSVPTHRRTRAHRVYLDAVAERHDVDRAWLGTGAGVPFPALEEPDADRIRKVGESFFALPNGPGSDVGPFSTSGEAWDWLEEGGGTPPEAASFDSRGVGPGDEAEAAEGPAGVTGDAVRRAFEAVTEVDFDVAPAAWDAVARELRARTGLGGLNGSGPLPAPTGEDVTRTAALARDILCATVGFIGTGGDPVARGLAAFKLAAGFYEAAARHDRGKRGAV